MRRPCPPAVIAILSCCLLLSCAPADRDEPVDTEEAPAAATGADLAHRIIIVDTHVDVPYRLEEKMEDISSRTESGDFDYPRAKAGGLDAPFMSIYVPASYQKKGGAKDYADKLIDLVESFEARWPEKFAVSRSPDDVRRNFQRGVISLPMGMENGAPIEDDLGNVKHFHDRGVSYITLTHSENNQICDSSYSKERTWNGLSPFGEQIVDEMNRTGIMIDVSHISDATLKQVVARTKAPVIASHSSCRRFTPGWERNIDDEGIRMVASTGGVVQINFGSAFLDEAANRQSTEHWDAVKQFREENGLEPGDEESERFSEEYWESHEKIFAELSDVVDHIDHVVELVGVDHVGFGSDFDGVGDSLPPGLKDVSDYPNLIAELIDRGYTEEDIRKIAGENLLRVWSEVRRISGELASESGS